MAVQRTKDGYDAWYYGNRKTFSSYAAAKAYEKKLKARGKPRTSRKTGNQSDRSRQVISSKSSSSRSSSPSSTGGISDAQKTQYANQLAQIRERLVGLRDQLSSRKGSTSSGSSAYQGGSIVDYLGSQGQDSSFANRSKLASQYGIANYQGTAAQNTQLLNTLRAGSVSSNSTGGVPSTAVSAGYTTQDVQDKRKQLEEIKTKALSIQDQLERLGQVAEADPFSLFDEEGNQMKNVNPLSDPDTLLNRYFQGGYDLTKAEKERDRLLNQISDDTSEYYQNREKGLRDAYREFGVDEKTENLAQIQKEMAERQKKLREDTQRLENDASFRGVSRGFANDQRERIKSQGAFDLANLAIVESAYAGDLDRSRELAQSLVDDQFNAFTGQIETYKAQLQALMPQLNEDQKKRALAIEIALDERARKIAQAKEDTELKYEYATLAAEMNAPLNVTRSILNATSADEAFMLAAPYMNEKQAITTGSSGATRGGVTNAFAAPGGTYPAGDISPWTGGLVNLNISTATNRDIENAARTEFSPDFSARMFSVLTQEQLRDFLMKYEEYQRSLGMNMPPEQALEEYLQYIGKSDSGSSSGSTDSSSTMDRAANFYQ